jgi:hypothetical protein
MTWTAPDEGRLRVITRSTVKEHRTDMQTRRPPHDALNHQSSITPSHDLQGEVHELQGLVLQP